MKSKLCIERWIEIEDISISKERRATEIDPEERPSIEGYRAFWVDELNKKIIRTELTKQELDIFEEVIEDEIWTDFENGMFEPDLDGV